QQPDCPQGTLRWVGSTGAACTAVGSACPDDEFPSPEALPSDASLTFVRSGALAGNGERTAPFGTIAEGLAAASPGGTVVVGPGTYEEALTLTEGRQLLGVCSDRVTLRGVESDGRALLTLRDL